MTPHEETSRKLVAEWLHKANADLAAAECLLSESDAFAGIVMFHCQQAAEKLLKAFLTWHQVEFPKTHAIGELLDLAAGVDAVLADDLAVATTLSPYGVVMRYPGEQPEPDPGEAATALDIAKRVRKTVLRALPLA